MTSATISSMSNNSAIMEAFSSVAHELVALLIFFATWAAVNHFTRKDKSSDPKKGAVGEAVINFGKQEHTSAEVTETMKELCQNQFTRGIRMYRQLVKTGQDKEIKEEAFYTAIVEAAIRVGMSSTAMEVIHRMKENKMVPSSNFVQSLLKLLAARKCFESCVEVWDLFEPEPDQVIYSCMTLATSELGQLDLCREFLERSSKHFTVVSRDYIPLLRATARRRDHESAIKILKDLMQRGMAIESVVFNTTLSACVNAQNVMLLEDLMAEMRVYQKGFEEKVIDTVSYNTLMKAYSRVRDLKGCFALLEEVFASDVEPDDVTFSTILDVCIDENENDLASKALEKMCASGVKMNCVLLTTLMKGFIRSKRLDMAMNVFASMKLENSQAKPDMITYSMLIKAQCDVGDMGTGLQILEEMLQNSYDIDDVVFTHLIEGCATVSNMALAEKLYNDMLDAKISPSIYTLTALVKVYGKCGQSERAWEIVRSMEQEHGLKPSVVIVTCLISGLIRQKKHAEAYDAFKWMNTSSGVTADAQGVQTMISGLADAQMWKELLQVARDALQPTNRQPKIRVSTESLNQALSAMLNRAERNYGRTLFTLMAENQVPITLANAGRRLGFDTK